jgi:hypothetical protein
MTDKIKNGNFDNQIDIEALISAPLVAASKANVVMLTGQTRFLLEYCFHKNNKGTYIPIIIEMILSRGFLSEEENEDNPGSTIKTIKQEKLKFGVPLLSLVPINSLAINKVTVDFEMEITSTNVWESTTANDSGKTITKKQVALKGKIKSEDKSKYKSSMSSKLKVNIEVNPLPLPLGLLSIMELYSKSIQPLPVKWASNK